MRKSLRVATFLDPRFKDLSPLKFICHKYTLLGLLADQKGG